MIENIPPIKGALRQQPFIKTLMVRMLANGLAKSRESPYFGIFPTVEFFGDLRYVTDFFSCFIIYQRKSFI